MHSVQHVLQNRRLVTASPEMTVFDVAVRMTDSGVGALPILDGGRLVGVFSERDLMSRVVVPGREPRTTSVSSVMTRNVVTADIGDRTDPCVQKMRAHGCRHLPVLASGQVIAMLSMRDMLRDELEEQSEENRKLRAYLHQEAPA